MVLIREDNSYLSTSDMLAIEKGVAQKGIHSIRLSKLVTDEDKIRNGFLYENDREAWAAGMDASNKRAAELNEKALDELSKHFVIYQYKDNREPKIKYGDKDWDLFFWCNGDMDYITLNPNSDRELWNQLADINKALNLLQDFKLDIDVAIQAKAIYDTEALNRVAREVFENINGEFVSFCGEMGKIKEVSPNNYGFFLKGARTKYLPISQSQLLQYDIHRLALDLDFN